VSLAATHRRKNRCARISAVAKELEEGKIASMKVLAVKEEQFLTDAKGKRTGVLLNWDTYERLREAAEEVADIHAYGALRDRAHAEIAAGQFETLANYRALRKRKAK